MGQQLGAGCWCRTGGGQSSSMARSLTSLPEPVGTTGIQKHTCFLQFMLFKPAQKDWKHIVPAFSLTFISVR